MFYVFLIAVAFISGLVASSDSFVTTAMFAEAGTMCAAAGVKHLRVVNTLRDGSDEVQAVCGNGSTIVWAHKEKP